MKSIKILFVLFFCQLGFTGCALYQSEARKKLEKEGLEFAAGGALFELSEQIPSGTCGSLRNLPDFISTPETLESRQLRNGYDIFVLAEHEKRMLLVSLERNLELYDLCLFSYPSKQQQIEALEEDFNWSKTQL